MDEQNPIKACLPISSHLINGVISNRSGRPSMKSMVRFGPQPKSMVAQMLSKMRTNKTNDFDKTQAFVDINRAIGVNDDFINLNKEHKLSRNCSHLDEITITSKDDNKANRNLNEATNNEIEASSQPKVPLMEKNLSDAVEINVNDVEIKSNVEKPIESEIVISESTHKSNHINEGNAHLAKHKTFLCDFTNCDYSCKFSSNLRKHKRVHTNEKPYLCDKCCFRTNFVNSLKAHKRTHTAERPYQCIHCKYKCNSSSNLKKHCLHRHSTGYVNVDTP